MSRAVASGYEHGPWTLNVERGPLSMASGYRLPDTRGADCSACREHVRCKDAAVWLPHYGLRATGEEETFRISHFAFRISHLAFRISHLASRIHEHRADTRTWNSMHGRASGDRLHVPTRVRDGLLRLPFCVLRSAFRVLRPSDPAARHIGAGAYIASRM